MSGPLKKSKKLNKNIENSLKILYNIIETKQYNTRKGLFSMLKLEAHQLNFSSLLYNKIPKNHILKQINSAISLNFINNLLKDSYCKGFGRPAKEPEMMMRILILQKLYNLSDERIIEELSVNLAYMWFIGINPDDNVPHSSLLSKFRTTRLKDIDLDNEDEKEESKIHKDITKKISVTINRVQEKLVDNSDTYFTELNDEEKKQIIINREKYKSAKNNGSVPLSYEFDDTQKEIDKNITEAMSKGKNLEEIEDKLKNKLKIKK